MLFKKRDYKGELLSAIRYNNKQEIAKLLKSPSDLFGEEDSFFEEALLYAVEKNDPQTVRMIIAAGGSKWDPGRKAAGLALCKAAQKGYEAIADHLLRGGANVYATDADGDFPLDYAGRMGNLPIINMLIAAGTDVDHKAENGGFALNSAVFYGQIECVKYLISIGADVNNSNNHGVAPLHWAAGKGYEQIADALIKAGAEINATQKDGSTPIIVSTINGHAKVTGLLIKAGADVNFKSEDGSFALNAAANNGQTECVKMLVGAGADVNNSNDHGVAPLHWAADKGYEQIADVLIKAGAEINATQYDGRTPLFLSATNGHAKVMELLIKAGADVNYKSEDGKFALNAAANNGQTKCVELLVGAGADVNNSNNFGVTPLHWAAGKGYEKIVDVLIKAGADVNVKDKDGYTPLHSAAWQEHAKIVEILIGAGAKLDVVDNKNNTPYQTAVLYKRKETVSVFLKALGPPDDGKTAEAIADLIGDGDEIVRGAALDALRDMQPFASRALAKKLWDPNEEIKKTAFKWFEDHPLPEDPKAGLRYVELGGKWNAVEAFDQGSADMLLNILRDRLKDTSFVYGRRDTTADIIRALGRAYPQIGDGGKRERIFDVMWECLESKDRSVVEAASSFLVENAIEKGLDELYPLLLKDHLNVQKIIVAVFGKQKDGKAIDLLLEAFDKVQPEAAGLISAALANSGDPRAFDPVLRFLFDKEVFDKRPRFFEQGYEAFFKDYYSVIRNLLYGLGCTTTETGGEYTNYFYEYDPRQIKAAIKDLCGIKTPVSSNLLHLASKLKDIVVTVAWGWNISKGAEGTISMGDVRSAAEAELSLRGDPPYDKANYTAKDAWIIKLTDQSIDKEIADLIKNADYKAMTSETVKKISGQNLLADVAKYATNYSAINEAVEKLTDQAALADVAKNASLSVRLKAVEKLTDQAALADIAKNDFDKDVRHVAEIKLKIERITDQSILSDMAKYNTDNSVRPLAKKRLQAIDIDTAKKAADKGVLVNTSNSSDDETIYSADWTVRLKAARKLTDQAVIAEMVKNDPEYLVRSELLSRLTDQNELAIVAKSDAEKSMRAMAANKSTDLALLTYIARNDADKWVRDVANDRWKALGFGFDKNGNRIN